MRASKILVLHVSMSSTLAWEVTHEALELHAKQRALLDFEEGGLLLAARRADVHRHFGYGSFVEYVERLLGYSPRVTHDKLRVAEALERLPELSRALRDGTLNYSQARELTRVATPQTEKIWLNFAQGRTARGVEKLVSGRRPGSLPDGPADPSLQRQVLRFEVSGETLASFREAVAKLQRDAGEHWMRRDVAAASGHVLGARSTRVGQLPDSARRLRKLSARQTARRWKAHRRFANRDCDGPLRCAAAAGYPHGHKLQEIIHLGASDAVGAPEGAARGAASRPASLSCARLHALTIRGCPPCRDQS